MLTTLRSEGWRERFSKWIWEWVADEIRGVIKFVILGLFGLGSFAVTLVFWLLYPVALLFLGAWALLFLFCVLAVNSRLQTIALKGYNFAWTKTNQIEDKDDIPKPDA